MRHRLADLLGPQAERLWIATFHSTGLRILRRHAHLIGYSDGFVVYDDGDSQALMKNILKEMGVDLKQYKPKYFLSIIDRAKNRMQTAEEFAKEAEGYKGNLAADVYIAYQQALFKANAMDFGDLLLNAVKLLKQEKGILRLYQETLQYVLVDEFQDTNEVQYTLTRLLTAHHRNLLVVGDDDQSIYAFRGATVQNILNFEKDFQDAKVIKLEQNYRSTSNILNAAHAVIEKNRSRKDKKLWTSAECGDLIIDYTAANEGDEAHFLSSEIAQLQNKNVSLNDIAVFYRTNAQSRAIEEEFMRSGLPYRIFGGLKFYERKEIKDIIAYLRIVTNESDNQALLRTINTPPRGIGQQSIKNIERLASDKSINLLDACRIFAQKNKNVARYVSLIEELQTHSRRLSLSKLIHKILELSEYQARLKAISDPTSESRLENLKELAGFAAQLEGQGETPLQVLQYFLDRIALTAGSDDTPGNSSHHTDITHRETISLMTLHLAKGLEFPFVFLTGTEKGLLPHYHSLNDTESIEEERRLCYVGMTRAMKKLYLTRAMARSMFSSGESFGEGGYYRETSPFMFDIPPTLLERVDPFSSNNEIFSTENILPDFLEDTPVLRKKRKGLRRREATYAQLKSCPSKSKLERWHL